MSAAAEGKALLLSACALAAITVAWVGGWAVREARDVDSTTLELVLDCLQNQRGLAVSSPAPDPLAASAPRGSLTTTIEGNAVTVSLWSAAAAAERTIETYSRLTPEDLTGRAVARGSTAVLWSAPPTATQESVLYGCTA